MKNKLTEVSAMAYLNMARQYHDAATTLLAVREQRPKGPHSDRVMIDPINFLYFHTVELALKAFLRAHDRAVLGTSRQSHKLTELYEECRSLGLVIGSDDRLTVGNIVPSWNQATNTKALDTSTLSPQARLMSRGHEKLSIR